jgi:hypothetical protein
MRRFAVAAWLAAQACFPSTAAGFPEVAGWKPVGETASYGRENLWQYIDGAADLFLAYGFRQLDARELESGEVRATVHVYDMGSPLGAFGVFAKEAAGGEIQPGIGAGWTVFPPEQCLLAKDRYYVKIETTRGQLSAASGESLARAVAAALPGADGLPEAMRLLPPDAAVAGSARYTMKGFLGLSEMPGCIHAPLAGGPSGAEVFLLVPREGETLDGLWRTLASKWSPVERQGPPVLVRQVPYHGTVGVIRSERSILGLAGIESRDELLRRLSVLAP